MATKLDARQSVLRAALGMVGSAANDSLDTIFPKIDAQHGKLFEDRNVLLTDGGLITWTGSVIQFTENLNIVLNQKISGAAPQVISLGSADQTLTNGQIWYAVVDRTAGTASTSIASSLPAATSANQEVFLIAKRVDAGDGTQRLYFRSGMGLNAGQTVRLGASGSGSGSGSGSPLTSLLYRAEFNDGFDEGPTASTSAVDSTKTNATYSAAKSLYQLSYDASKTVTGTGTSMTLYGTPAFTIAINDMLIVGTQARRITALTSQTVFTIESAFTTDPAASACCVSQAVQTKDVYNLTVDGYALASAFGSATFSDILVSYEDTSTVGDAIFDVNTAPVIGYTASANGTDYTSVALRVTNETDTATNLALPAAGTALYLRFFANKSSGSGTVNVLRYDAYMQKTTASSSGGVQNSAYAFTNSVGTPVNCTVGFSGGKTTITLNFQYAVGVNASTNAPYGSLDVYLDGKLIPRFINSTLTPDASYLETSANVITLDRDYSSYNLAVEVLQRVAVIDTNTTNTTSISNINEIFSQGFQGFVSTSNVLSATSIAGTPVAGRFYSSVLNRAPIVDISQDLRAAMGIDRIPVQQIYALSNEFGANGETVLVAANDDRGLMRFVGSTWQNYQNSNGSYVGTSSSAASTSEYVEVTFYGTGLNCLIQHDSASRDYRVSVDGGAESSNILPAGTPSGVLFGRGYAPNISLPLAHGLSLGVHTVKLRNNTVNGIFLLGFEVVNSSSTVALNSGSAYINGGKLALASAQSLAYNSTFDSGALAARGGHVVTYLKSDGTIGKAVTPANGAAAFLTNADHTNEETVRVYNWREFGAARSDDFSLLNNTGSNNVTFTLEDGTTTLAGSAVGNNSANNGGPYLTTTGSFLQITFVGTGLDIVRLDPPGGATTDTTNVFVDGTNVGNLATASSSIQRVREKIVSGLPYGTHVVRFLRPAASLNAPGFFQFIIYQPKKPTLPSGAVELADYNVMATFSANSTAGLDTISTGVLRKSANREFNYNGSSWGFGSVTPSTYTSGVDLASNSNGAFTEYTFFGTGFDFRSQANTTYSNNISVQLQNVGANGSLLAATTANFPSLTSSVYGGFSFASGTLSQAVSNTNGSGLVISGLPLSVWKVRFVNNTTNFLTVEALDIITPIHSYKSNLNYDQQNTLPVGSCSISDNRKTSAIKESHLQKKIVAQAIGITSGVTTSSTVYVPCPEMSLVITSPGDWFDIQFECSMLTSAQNTTYLQIFVNGAAVGAESAPTATNAMYSQATVSVLVYLAPGTHKVDGYWHADGAVLSAAGTRRHIKARN